MDEPAFRILRMVEATPDVAAARRPNHDRHADPPTRPVPEGGGLIHDLVEAAADEVRELHLGHGPVAALRRPDADAHDRGFRNGRVQAALLTEFLRDALGHAERT